MVVLVDGDEEGGHVFPTVAHILLHELAVGFLAVEHAAAGETLVEGDALVLILHVAQLGYVHCFCSALRITYVELELAQRDILVGKHLAGSHQSVERVARIGIAAEIRHLAVDAGAIADVVARNNDVVGLQRTGQNARLHFDSALRGSLRGIADGEVVVQDNAVAGHAAVHHVRGNQHYAADGGVLAFAVLRGILIYYIMYGARTQRHAFNLGLHNGVGLIQNLVGALCTCSRQHGDHSNKGECYLLHCMSALII